MIEIQLSHKTARFNNFERFMELDAANGCIILSTRAPIIKKIFEIKSLRIIYYY